MSVLCGFADHSLPMKISFITIHVSTTGEVKVPMSQSIREG